MELTCPWEMKRPNFPTPRQTPPPPLRFSLGNGRRRTTLRNFERSLLCCFFVFWTFNAYYSCYLSFALQIDNQLFASQLPVLLYPSPPEKGSKEETTLQQPTLHISATKEPSRLPNVEIFKVRQLTITALPLLFLIQNISVCDWLNPLVTSS